MSSFEQVAAAKNPLLDDWSQYEHGFPPFDQLKASDYESALNHAMEENLKDVKAIVENDNEPTFENTIVALDNAGELFDKVMLTFDNLCSSIGTPEYQEIEMKMAAPLADHHNKIAAYPGLFPKIDKVYQQRHELNLTDVQKRLIERYHLDFVRAGAKFTPEIQEKYGAIMKELAELTTQFTQNVVADEAGIFVELKTPEDKAGLPSDLINAARSAAKERNIEGEDTCIITLSRSLVEPFLVYSSRRDLREKAWRLWTSRGELDPTRDNYKLIQRILQLRQQRADYHGYTNFSEYALADTMAGKPARVMELLQEVWAKGKGSIANERAELEAYIRNSEDAATVTTIEPWDWRYYAEKVRIQNYALDFNELKPYFTLSNMLASLFNVANRLFGLEFVERPTLPTYHSSVKTYEVYVNSKEAGKERELVGIFISDNYARAFKHSGAWMSNYREQGYDHATNTRIIPIVVNNNNFNPPVLQPETNSSETFVSIDDAITLFHEFGHGLHGLLSNVPYGRLAGTCVLRDFVELPSQLFEHWALEKQQLQVFATHYQTKEPVPMELIEKLLKARKFNQGFQTVEYTASALVDIMLHMQNHSTGDVDLPAFEKRVLGELGMPKGVVMRHRLPHFQHLFSGDGYASAYYVYLWAEVLDADGYEAFTETGDIFNAEVAARVKQYIYSAGNSQDPAALYRLFRGRDPIIEPMLRKKGLVE